MFAAAERICLGFLCLSRKAAVPLRSEVELPTLHEGNAMLTRTLLSVRILKNNAEPWFLRACSAPCF